MKMAYLIVVFGLSETFEMEVDIDGALSACEKDFDEDVVWIDQLLESAVKDKNELNALSNWGY